MAIYKCKMCGGSLEVQDGVTVCECEYCGSKQTIPSNTDENIRALYNRANVLRMKAEFDKAEDIYEKILQLNSTEAEAYWGLILCKYGVEYVEDPKTMKRVPTCHRTSYEAITADDDYKNAIYYASIDQKIVYEAEAKTIDEIQKGILLISQKEDPYDVFICYKEADENGQRTKDSVIANDIYYQLTQQGFKVFYAAITLEDKLGSEYEPYIFSALNSAKVMLALGTKPEYFNAVWVKNEWSRFLRIMKKDRSKLLIPCYRDMDAYELPEEFAHLQAQDMSKIGFINDIVRGIKKVIVKDEPKTVVKETVVLNDSVPVGVAPLLKRTAMFLEDKNWSRAHELCDQVLNADPENAQAYVYELMGDLQVPTQAGLVNCSQPFDGNKNYNKAIRFGSPELKAELEGYTATIKERNETDRKNKIYSDALKTLISSTSESSYREAAKLFQSIPGWKDSDEKWKEAWQKADAAKKDSIYQQAKGLSSRADSKSIADAIKKFESIPGWKDADNQAAELVSRLEEAKEREAVEEQERLRIAELQRQYDQKYKPLIDKKASVETSITETRNKLSAEENATTSRWGVGITIWGVIQFGLGVICLFIEAIGTGILNVAIGGLILYTIIALQVKRNKKIAQMRKDLGNLQNQLNEIENIPSFGQFCESLVKK